MTALDYLSKTGRVTKKISYYGTDSPCRSVCYELPSCRVILDYAIFSHNGSAFGYDVYTDFQNQLVAGEKPVYRFLSDTDSEEIKCWVEGTVEFSSDTFQGLDRALYVCDSTPLEHFFEQRFCEVYGNDALLFLHKEYPLMSLGGSNLFLDYVVEYRDGTKVAVEENGVTYHHPQLIGPQSYAHQLEKQNICSYLGIKLYRFSSEDCRFPDHVDDQILQFFGNKESFKTEGLSAQRPFTLYQHQAEALEEIQEKRELSGNDPVAILEVFPTASGKSRIVEEDLGFFLGQNPEARVLIVGPTVRIMQDWLERIRTKFYGTAITYGTDASKQVLIGTYYALWHLQGSVSSDWFSYIVVDEAHHAVAPMVKHSLQYFAPRFLIGLTATPDRLDRKKLEAVFGSYRTTFDLHQAIEKGIVANIRAFRIETNLDLSEVRFNGHAYVNADLEKTIHVDARNRLIVSVLEKYFLQTKLKGIIFCVNIAHSEEVARLLSEAGIPSAAISSKTRDVEATVKAFKAGALRFLCSCNMLNEGWDVPEVEVLVMARPTLSKVMYLQQLGRGLRKTKDKKELFVLDVVDQYGALARPWSSHAILGNPNYVPFGLLVNKQYTPGEIINVLGLYETVREIVPVSLQTFEQEYGDYLELERAARDLYVGTMTLRSWVQNKSVQADLVIPFGRGKLLYFKKDTVEEIRRKKNLKVHTDETIVEDFKQFIEEKNFTFSFKIVFMQAMLAVCDANGTAPIKAILTYYQRFYQARIEMGLPVDKETCIYSKEFLNDTVALQRSMLENPFEKYERKRFVYYGKDIGLLAFNPILWQGLGEEDKIKIGNVLQENLQQYYAGLGGM